MGFRDSLEASDMCLAGLGWFSWKEAMLSSEASRVRARHSVPSKWWNFNIQEWRRRGGRLLGRRPSSHGSCSSVWESPSCCNAAFFSRSWNVHLRSPCSRAHLYCCTREQCPIARVTCTRTPHHRGGVHGPQSHTWLWSPALPLASWVISHCKASVVHR